MGADDNQLIQVADNEERLRYLREVFGATSNLTALQPVVVVEGISEHDATRAVADRKLYRALHAGFDQVTLLPGGGKGQCKALLDVLGPALATFSSRLKAVALLDRDQSVAESRADVFLLPVAMIENLLLDPDSIWEAIQSVFEKTSLASVGDVAAALDAVLDEQEAAERERRVVANLGIASFRPARPLADLPAQLATFVDEVASRYSADHVAAITAQTSSKLEQLKIARRRREEFHGKSVLDAFFKQHLHSTGLQKGVFVFETARHARRRKAVTEYFDKLVEQMRSGLAVGI